MDLRLLCSGFAYLKLRHSRHDDKCGLNVNVSNLDTQERGNVPRPTILTISTRSIPNATVVRTSPAVLPRPVLLNHALPNPTQIQYHTILHAEPNQQTSSTPSNPSLPRRPKIRPNLLLPRVLTILPGSRRRRGLPRRPRRLLLLRRPGRLPRHRRRRRRTGSHVLIPPS